MSADRKLFNRRELRRKLGTRANRRANTKSPVTTRNRDGSIERKLKARPAARLNQMIEEIKNNED